MKKTQRFVSAVRDARKGPLIDRLGRLKLQTTVQIEVPEVLLARLDRPESHLQATTVTNQPTIYAVNTLRVEVKKLLEQRSWIPNHPGQNSTCTQLTSMHSKPGSASGSSHTIALRTQDGMETIYLLFSTGQDSTHITPLNVAYFLSTT